MLNTSCYFVLHYINPLSRRRERVETAVFLDSTPILTFPLQGGRNGFGTPFSRLRKKGVSFTRQEFIQCPVLRCCLSIVGAASGCDTLAGARHARVHRGLPRRTVTRLDRLEAGQRRPGNEMSGL